MLDDRDREATAYLEVPEYQTPRPAPVLRAPLVVFHPALGTWTTWYGWAVLAFFAGLGIGLVVGIVLGTLIR